MMRYEQLLQPARFSQLPADSLLEATEADRARVVQSAPVRRLQQKTQVFPLDVKASVRSRLTHSLEVQQVGRQICRALLRAKEDAGLPEMPLLNLLEMACLLHDVGNPPFGHFGESVLREWLGQQLPVLYAQCLAQEPSELWTRTLQPDLLAFDGNAQSLRLAHSLQQMDLTYSLLATLIKVPVGMGDGAESGQKIGYFYSERPLVSQLRQQLGVQVGQRFPLVYLMEAADDLCYCIADLEDAIDRGLLTLPELQRALLAQAGDDPYLGTLLTLANGSLDGFFPCFREQLTRDLVDVLASTYMAEEANILAGQFASPLLGSQHPCVAVLSALRRIARQQIFTRREVQALELQGHAALSGVLGCYQRLLALPRAAFTGLLAGRGMEYPFELRLCHRISRRHIEAYQRALREEGSEFASVDELEWYYRVRLLLDYISGMTDTYILEEFRLLCGI